MNTETANISKAESLRMLDSIRDTVNGMSSAITDMLNISQNKLSREMAETLNAYLKSATRILDRDGLV
jgi:hypothetical protein